MSTRLGAYNITPQVSAGRGQPVLKNLTSTRDFTKPNKLSLDERKLLLFLLVAMADEQGGLTKMHRTLFATYGDHDGHWCNVKDLPAMRRKVGKYLGKSAERLPTWDKIVNMVHAAVDDDTASGILPVAAGLFRRAVGPAHPGGDYSGLILLPLWADEPDVTIAMIQEAGLPAPPPPVPRPREKPAPAPVTAAPEPARTDPAPRRPAVHPGGEDDSCRGTFSGQLDLRQQLPDKELPVDQDPVKLKILLKEVNKCYSHTAAKLRYFEGRNFFLTRENQRLSDTVVHLRGLAVQHLLHIMPNMSPKAAETALRDEAPTGTHSPITFLFKDHNTHGIAGD